MAQLAANGVAVTSQTYGDTLDVWFAQPVRKVTLDVSTASIYVQFSEARDRHSYPEPIESSEQLIRPGVRSRVFGTPVWSMRLRAASATAASVNYVADA